MGMEINSNKGKEKEKKTTELSVRRGARFEIGELVVLGGALAVAALIAALTNKARNRRPTATIKDPPKPTGLTKTLKNSCHCSCAEGGNEGLRSLLRTPSQSVQCQHSNCFFCDQGLSRISSTHINFSEFVILETNVNSSKETDEKTSYNTEAWNIPAFEFDDYNIKDGTPVSTMEVLPLLNDVTISPKQENIEKSDDIGGEDDESFEQREEEEGSERTTNSSVDSIAEAVWPAESIEAEMLDFKETKAYCLYSAEKNDKGAYEDEITGNTTEILDLKGDMEFNMVNHASSSSSRSRDPTKEYNFCLDLSSINVMHPHHLHYTSTATPESLLHHAKTYIQNLPAVPVNQRNS
ncbi:hypothetical protein NE237_015501 [Protea cynaroides]|uniref:Uncharacterized protein n=1 Tax=Protea cynaroides TaxID=273540 RepID=A0A9Q0QR01_9MAGN|nr:hypothetical protein NE237_015501 [Protea cynaroides]